jgi:hypothetical protein
MKEIDAISEYLSDINERFSVSNTEDYITETDVQDQQDILYSLRTDIDAFGLTQYNMGYLAGYRDGMKR